MAKRRAKAKEPRASWKGRLTIDLVSFKVEAFNSVSSDEGGDPLPPITCPLP